MKEGDDGLPVLGAGARYLGARRGIDIPVDENGLVGPGNDGMSVAPDSIDNLPRLRRPPSHGGSGVDPVFVLSESVLGPDLYYRPDPERPAGHGFVEPARRMSFDEYQRAIWATRLAWVKV
jgi:hypothetical protein